MSSMLADASPLSVADPGLPLLSAGSVATVRFQTPRYHLMRVVFAALGDEPRSPRQLAVSFSRSRSELFHALDRLVSAGLAVKVRDGCNVRRTRAVLNGRAFAAQPEVGRQILSFLSEPRRACEIARHIGRSSSCATGHLRHLLKRQLVVRLEWGIYALPAHRPHAQSTELVRRVRGKAARVLELLECRRTVGKLEVMLETSHRSAEAVVQRLQRAGLVTRLPQNGYIRAEMAVATEASARRDAAE